MPITVTCACGKTFKVSDHNAGRRGRCKACGNVVRIPDATVSVPPDDDGDVYLADDVALPSGSATGPAWSPASAWSTAAATTPPAAVAPPPFPPIVADDSGDYPAPVLRRSVPASSAMPPEPWFYKVLWYYANVLAVLGVIQFGVMILFVLVQVALAFRTEVPGLFLFTAGITLLWSLGIFLAVLLVAAPILLFVDSARNLRAMRYGA